MTDKDFSTLPLASSWLENLAQLGYREMTPIQALALPLLLAGRDVLGQAGTGTGKTAAFGLALLARIKPGRGRPGALVLCPTRELAGQVAEEIRRLARPLPHTKVLTLSGGSSITRERESLGHGADVVVGTPGRIQDHLARGRLDLGEVSTVVLDEADRMLEMGFVEAVTAIVRATPAQRQTLLFSATFPESLSALSGQFQLDPARVEAPSAEGFAQVEQRLYEVPAERASALTRVLANYRPESAVVFCNERATCDLVADRLSAAGFPAVALHGGMEQPDRETVLLLFRNGSLRLLVATDVAARGLDIEDLAAVVNYELPRDPDVYLHRIGRTGRAGKSGLAISLVGSGDHKKLEELRQSTLADVPLTELAELEWSRARPAPPTMRTIALAGGRKDKLRPGDIVGALTNDIGIAADEIGPIKITDRVSYVALREAASARALAGINRGQIKKRRFRAYLVEPPTAKKRG